MRHTACLLSPARALHRVLLLELASRSNSASSSPIFAPALSNALTTPRHALPTSLPTRRFQPCIPDRARTLTTSRASKAPVQRKKHLRDKEIPFRWVRIADPATGELSAPKRTDAVLASLPPKHSLVMVAPPPPPQRSQKDASASAAILQPTAAICRIIDAGAKAEAAAAAAKESKRVGQQTKTLELNWAIAPNDLAHKLRRLDEFLGKGMRVEILFARKKRTRKATPEEGEALLARVQEAVAQVPGATEYKQMAGHVGGTVRMFIEGSKNKKAQSNEESKVVKDE
ncbi:hypothetical protein F5Y19DRAFT_347368 [Xylariaceae sp. FL1651]|nr:hypothetical protein F5Y19DRAFT_347368 [Xylariaceae sp. FL1651]